MRNKLLFIILLPAILSSGFTTDFETKTNFLSWTEHRKLSWDDFQGAIDSQSSADAATAIHILAEPYRKNRKIFYNVNAYFIKEKSWSRERSQQLLAHEQLHFDIAELYARKIRKLVSDYRSNGIRDVTQYHSAIIKLLDESNHLDKLYDFKTVHGALPHKQLAWEESIRFQLKNLDSYSTVNWESN